MRVAETQDSSDAINMNAGRLLSAGGWSAMNEPKKLHMYTGMQTSTNTVPTQKKMHAILFFINFRFHCHDHNHGELNHLKL